MKAGSLFAVLTIAVLLAVPGCTAKDEPTAPSGDKITAYDSTAAQEESAADDSTAAQETDKAVLIADEVGYDFGVTDLSGKSDIREELLSHILEFQNMSEEDAAQRSQSDEDFAAYYSKAYLGNKIDELTEFYYPDIAIDGFTMYAALIDEQYISYRFAPNEKLGIGSESQFGFGDIILITIARTHWIDTEHPLDALIQQYDNTHVNYILEDGLLYGEGKQSISGIMGITRFKLYGPRGADDYDSLAALAKRVVESAELVIVKYSSTVPEIILPEILLPEV